MMKFFIRDDPRGKHPWPFLYFHAQMEQWVNSQWNDHANEESWCAPDLVSSDTQLDEVKDGTHDCTVYGKPGKLYIWTEPHESSGWTITEGSMTSFTKQLRRGLIVCLDDTDAVEYAQEKMNELAVYL